MPSDYNESNIVHKDFRSSKGDPEIPRHRKTAKKPNRPKADHHHNYFLLWVEFYKPYYAKDFTNYTYIYECFLCDRRISRWYWPRTPPPIPDGVPVVDIGSKEYETLIEKFGKGSYLLVTFNLEKC